MSDTRDVAVLGGMAVIGYVVVSGFSSFSDALGELFSVPMRAADEGLGVVEAGTDAVESAFSIPDTVFSGVSSGLQSGGETVGSTAGDTFDTITSTPRNVYDGVTGGISSGTETVSDGLSRLNPF